MIVDVHCHHLPASVIEDMAGFEVRESEKAADGPDLFDGGARLGPVPDRLIDLEILMAESDRHGVDVRILCAPSWLHRYDLDAETGSAFAATMNDAMADAVAQHPDRLMGLATVALQDVDGAVGELDRAVNSLGFRGVATDTHVNGRYFDDRSLWPFLEAAAELGVPVFLHPGAVLGTERMDLYRLKQMIGNPHESAFAAVRTVLGGVVEQFPDLHLCFVQVGGSLPAVLGRIEHTWRVRGETRRNTHEPPTNSFRRLFFDSIAHSPEPIEWLLRHVPDRQILMGTDYPWDMGEAVPGQSIRALPDVGHDAIERMLGLNAARLLRLGFQDPSG